MNKKERICQDLISQMLSFHCEGTSQFTIDLKERCDEELNKYMESEDLRKNDIIGALSYNWRNYYDVLGKYHGELDFSYSRVMLGLLDMLSYNILSDE